MACVQDAMVPRADREFVYVSKFPPSPSGIGLYAEAFEQALTRIGTVRRHAAPSRPTDGQTLGAAHRGLRDGWRHGRRMPGEHVHVELAGRSLYEFYYAVGATAAKSPMSVTAHDLPSLVGPPMLFTGLDRRGLRRLGILFSSWFGSRLERFVIRRALAVCALTPAGAEWLSDAYEVSAVSLGHVVDSPEPPAKEKIIFCPGYIGDPDPIVQLMGLMGEEHPDWRIIVGSATDAAGERIRAAERSSAVSIELTGHLEEPALLEMFSRAQIVMRVRAAGGANSLAASGPLAWALARGCVVITNDRRPGAVELGNLGLIHMTDDWLEAIARELDQSSVSHPGPGIADRAQEHLGAMVVAGRLDRALARGQHPSTAEL